MRILFLTPRFPSPPDRGDRLTVYRLLQVFSRRHEVVLATFVDGHEPAEAYDQVSRVCARILTVRLSPGRSWLQAWVGLPLLRPSQVSYYHSGRMRARLERLLAEERFDLIFTHPIRMAGYGARLRHPLKVLWIGDSLGLALSRSMRFAAWWRRPGLAWERWRLDRFTARMSRHFRESWAVSPDDLAHLRGLGCPDLALVPHGVDERLFGLERRPDPGPSVVFLGNLSVPHNVDAAAFAARDIWPAILRDRPEARLRLAGANPARAVRRLARLPGVEVTGTLPDLLPLWSGAHVLLAPLRFSTGIQNKVLEAMAAGVPVVTTPQVARGIGARPGEHLSVAESAADLARAVLDVLAQPDAAAERCRRARDHVARHFTWDAPARRLEWLVQDAAGAPGRPIPDGPGSVDSVASGP